MKPWGSPIPRTWTPVAPHAGAWIETLSGGQPPREAVVAPHAGAWIETVYMYHCAASYARRPPRGGVD